MVRRGRAGEALLTLAAAYPKSTFHGYDIAQQSLDFAASRCVTATLLALHLVCLVPHHERRAAR